VSDNNDYECEQCCSKAGFKKLQLRMGIIIHCKVSKKYHFIFPFRKHLLLTLSQKPLHYSRQQIILQKKDPEKFISTVLLESEVFKKEVLFYEGDSSSAGSASPF